MYPSRVHAPKYNKTDQKRLDFSSGQQGAHIHIKHSLPPILRQRVQLRPSLTVKLSGITARPSSADNLKLPEPCPTFPHKLSSPAMESRTGRTRSNTVTVQNDIRPPPHIPRLVLLISFVVAVLAIVTQFNRRPMPSRRLHLQPPTTNVTSVSDLVRAVVDFPHRGHFFRTGCFSVRSLLCHTLHDVSYVLDAVDVSDDGEAYVFRISKDEVHSMRRNIFLRRERLDGCTPWQHGSFFMKLDWILLYYLPTSIASSLFGASATEAGYRRDRWGWCVETLPFGRRRAAPSVPQGYYTPTGDSSPSYKPKDDFSQTHGSDNANEQTQQTEHSQNLDSTPRQGSAYRDDPVNHEALAGHNQLYAR